MVAVVVGNTDMLCLYPRENGVPCGQCQNCLINKQLSWKFRLKKEVLYNDFAFWLTLQYEDCNLRLNNDNIPIVSKLDCQNYFRQIRKFLLKKDYPFVFKYFLVSEYGPETHRPHYHCLILFRCTDNLSFNDLFPYRQKLYTLLKDRWYHGTCYEKLFHSGVIGYLTKYVFKSGDSFVPPVLNFRLISKGIGEDYFNSIDRESAIKNLFLTPDGYLPRYYRDKLLPYSKGLKHTSVYWKRKEIQNNLLDKIEFNLQYKAAKFNSLDEFIDYQNFIRSCQRRKAEKLQLQKYG